MVYRNIIISLVFLDDGEFFLWKEYLKLMFCFDIMILFCFKIISECVNVLVIKFVGNV